MSHLPLSLMNRLNQTESAVFKLWILYPNFPKFSDRHVWANSADPDQTAPRGAV